MLVVCASLSKFDLFLYLADELSGVQGCNIAWRLNSECLKKRQIDANFFKKSSHILMYS